MDSKPVIGLSMGFLPEDPSRKEVSSKAVNYLKEEYSEAIVRAGGVPILIPNTISPGVFAERIHIFDGIVFTGGYDIEPRLYGERVKYPSVRYFPKRDELEFTLIEHFRGPMLGICRGMQVVNIAFGGTLYQDLREEFKGGVDHGDWNRTTEHEVLIEPQTILRKLVGEERIVVNSSHHQGIKVVAPAFRVCALARDGLVEAIELPKRHILAVQWHPESLRNRYSDAIFEWLIRACREEYAGD